MAVAVMGYTQAGFLLEAFQMEKTVWEWIGSCTESPQRGLIQVTESLQCCTALFWRK